MSTPKTGSIPVKLTTRTLIWTGLSVLLYFLLLPLLSAIDGPDGLPWIDSSVIGEQIKQFGLITSVAGPFAVSLLKDVKDVKHEVKNDHTTNMRVENDSRHAETLKLLSEVKKDIGGIRQELCNDRKATSDRFDVVHGVLSEHSERISHQTQQRRR